MSDNENTIVDQTAAVGAAPAKTAAADLPKQIGRYRVEKVLGKGGFGLVYLAHDDQLQRLVAIKVPHHNLLSRTEEVEAYMAEARTLANLDHPNIVPVHDVGSSREFPCFIVSKFIEGCTLEQRIKDNRPGTSETVELIATVGEALHYAHHQRLVHRDIKPGNILLDASGKPFVVDFGLALKEENVGQGPKFAGTPLYMSPEQARGEGHRVDGRSDIFSLGVVFYEMLTGRRPFRADTQSELLEQIANVEVRPLRQWDDRISKELERICLKMLAKRASERYTTAKDMAEDLRLFVNEQTVRQPSSRERKSIGFPLSSPSAETSATQSRATRTNTPTSSDNRPLKIVPKGLRSFDARDADFFLELLPGPRDRDGLPDSIRFWRDRIAETDPDNTFAVGLIYGPSGCGKSSMVKAGLLPRLPENVMAVYIEATAEETETRLLNGLRKRCPDLSDTLDLKETLAALRQGQGIAPGKKVLIVLDQFEQWLHAKKEEQNTELVRALRQCDGGRLQCLLMVRDDFWMAATRCMKELEVRLLEGHNSAAVDLFPMRHAEKVLAAFGRAFGVLPDVSSRADKDQKRFLEQAVSGLAQEGKVVSVRLALFAEMMKNKTWTPATLKEVGGTEGVGVTFLEEKFSSSTAPPEYRYHQKAARAVLKALLPESGTNIKGHMRSHSELLKASGCASRAKDFDDLIRILDSDIRLITPTDPEGKEDGSISLSKAGEKYFQLAHDYLVPSLRDWLTRKQKETRRGRSELALADRAAVWNQRPENRQLPSFPQWLGILWLTKRKNWTRPQRKMMRRANRFHAMQGIIVGLLLAVVAIAGLTIRDRIDEQKKKHQAAELAIREHAAERQKVAHAADLVERLLGSQTTQVPVIIRDMFEYRQWVDPLLREANAKEAETPKQKSEKLRVSLALMPVDPSQVDYLYSRFLDAQAYEVTMILDALGPQDGPRKQEFLDKLWAVAEKPTEKGKKSQHLQAASALAKYDAQNPRWDKLSVPVVNELVLENPIFLSYWRDAFAPVKDRLLPHLSEIFRDQQLEHTAERSLATNLLADYFADQPNVLADLLMDANDKQFAVVYRKLKDHKDHVEKGLLVLVGEIDRKLPPDATDEAKEALAKRQANAAVVLLKMNQPEKVWPLLKHSPDPRVRSYLIHRLAHLGSDAGAIVKRLNEEPDVTIRRALILSLGEFAEKGLSPEVSGALLQKLEKAYRTDDDPGIHAAVEWLLREWKHETWLKQENEKWANEQVKRFDRIKQNLAKEKDKTPPQWYVNGQGQTMVVIPGPVEFMMGSPPTELNRRNVEVQHRMGIGRTFAIAAKPVTWEQYLQFAPQDEGKRKEDGFSPSPDCPVNNISWYTAAKYCNWLSKQEKIPEKQWCYETDEKGQVTKLKANYLSSTGYRLPTEAEMEYATRARSSTSRYYGETDELLPKYAWYQKNSQEHTQPVGSLKPNDLGLFDVLGNVNAWCQESYKAYLPGDATSDDKEDETAIERDRVLRGGAFQASSSRLRSAGRNHVPPSRDDGNGFGFRPARTITP